MIINSEYVGENLLFVLREIQRDWNVECIIALRLVKSLKDTTYGLVTTGLYKWNKGIAIAIKERTNRDIIKSTLHEVAHYKQYQDGHIGHHEYRLSMYKMSTRASEREAERFAKVNLSYYNSML